MCDRLIELLKKKYDHFCDQCGVNKDSHYIENLADYLIANGVIVPPIELCEQIGGTIFVIADDEPTEVMLLEVAFNYWGQDEIATYDEQDEKVRNYRFAEIGKTVFLTREEAEEALKGGVE